MLTTVLIDQREPDWVQGLTFGGAPTLVTLLETGDIQATTDDGATLAIERKTADDLLNSLKDGRLLEQVARLAALTPWCYLAICGTLQRGPDGKLVTDRGVTGWQYEAVQGALLSMQELGVYVIQTTDDRFEATVLGLANRNRTNVLRQKPAKTLGLLTPGETLLASLPGIGLERVGALLAYAGSPAAALSYLTEPTLRNKEHVPGIGPSTKEKVRAALGIRPEQELCVIYTQDKEPSNVSESH